VCNVWAGVVKFIVAILSPRHVMYFQAIVEPLLRRSDLMVFKMAAIADFKKFKFITTGGVKRSNMRHHAKFYADRFNCWCDMAIFDFLNGLHPPSWIRCVCSDHPRRVFGGLCPFAKFIGIDVVLIICMF